MEKDQAPAIIATAVVFMGVGAVAVALRFLARSIKKTFFGWDDWSILIALLLFILATGLELKGAVALWHYDGTATDPNITIYTKYIYIYAPFYYLSIGATNISILLFYRRLFSFEFFKKISMIFIYLNVAWTIAGTLVEIWACNPPEYDWDRTIEGGVCIFYGTFWLAIMLIEVIIEFCMLLLPITEVRKLYLSTRRKWSVAGVFLLGSFVIISAIVRIAVCYEGSETIQFNKDAIWVNVHCGVAILSACLPTYKPFMVAVLERFGIHSSQNGTYPKPSFGSSTGNSSSTGGKSWKNMESQHHLQLIEVGANGRLVPMASIKGDDNV